MIINFIIMNIIINFIYLFFLNNCIIINIKILQASSKFVQLLLFKIIIVFSLFSIQ